MLQKQYKALSGSGVSVATIALIVGYLNTAFGLGMGPEVVAAVAVFVGVLMYLVVYFVPNIDKSIINIDDIDLESALTTSAKDYDIPPETIKSLAGFMDDTLKGLKQED